MPSNGPTEHHEHRFGSRQRSTADVSVHGKRPLPNAWGQEHGAAHAGGLGAVPAGELETWAAVGGSYERAERSCRDTQRNPPVGFRSQRGVVR